MKSLEEMQNEYIQKYNEITLVMGEGSYDSGIFLIGEAPGGDEEKQGHPFVGKAGKNLDKFIEIVGVDRKDLYITNTVKLRPSKISGAGRTVNRKPTESEIADFLPLLKKEIETVKPRLIVTLGNTPLRAVTGKKDISIGSVHGTVVKTEDNLNIFPLYHPAAVIYNASLNDIYVEDLHKLSAVIDAMPNI